MILNGTPASWTKNIPPARDRLQSRILVWTLAPILCALSLRTVATALRATDDPRGHYLVAELIISLTFSLLVWILKAATPAAAACGGAVCLLLTDCTLSRPPSLLRSGLPPLALLFALTYLAARFRRAKKEARGLSEPRTGRRASQVIANLGIAALFAAFSRSDIFLTSTIAFATAIVALAEATADTVSSEIGQAIAGPAFLITTLRRVPPGTDGAISLYGTLAGFGAAAIIAATGGPAMGMSPAECAVAFAAGVCGLFFDSLLGATLERRGWLGNDLVNFTSTAAAVLGLLAIRVGQKYLLR